MGSDGFWDFGSKAVGGWGSNRLLSNMRAWLTTHFSTEQSEAGEAPPVYQGWHDWHIDGPAQGGRYHKFFLMVNKSTEVGAMARTNVRLVPADVLYAYSCAFEEHMEAAGQQLDRLLKYVRAPAIKMRSRIVGKRALCNSDFTTKEPLEPGSGDIT